MKRCRWIYLHIAFISLTAGYFVYFFARPDTPIFTIPYSLQHWQTPVDWLIPITGSLPDFLHTYAFILLTYLVLGTGTKKHLYYSVLLWLVIETSFELIQWQPLSNLLLQQTVALDFPGLSLFKSFVQHGTFDPLDLFAIAMASVFAYFTVSFISLKGIDR